MGKYEIWIVKKDETTGALFTYSNEAQFQKNVTFWSRRLKQDKNIEEVQFKRFT